jgi:Protein of unknown function (DUF2537)
VPHNGGPTVLREGDVSDARLSGELRTALREWSDVAETVIRSGDVEEVDLLRRRGRQLARRAADALGRPVEFVDPVSGSVESIAGTGLAGTGINGAGVDGAGVDGAVVDGVPTNGVVTAGRGVDAAGHAATNGAAARGASAIAPRQTLEPPGPTPWGTGLTVSAFFAVVVALADIVLANAFAGAFGLLWIPANLLVTVGTVPSLWLAREVPFWRWPALGAAAGLAAAWVVMVLALLGS